MQQFIKFFIFGACFFITSCRQNPLTIADLGKNYDPPMHKLLPGMYHHITPNDSVLGGNTSIRNMDEKSLSWKGDKSGNGYGYFVRNRDLGNVFTVDKGFNVKPEALVLRTSRGNNAIMDGVSGAELYVVFFEVKVKEGEELRINENGTTKGDFATHGFDLQYNRADDYLEGAEYIFLQRFSGGIFPKVNPTSQFVYDQGKGLPYGEQEGHLRYFRFSFPTKSDLILKSGKQYAFMIGFSSPAKGQGLAFAITTKVHSKEAAEFIRDVNGEIRWGIRREGSGKTPPTMIGQDTPPEDQVLYNQLINESMFPPNHYETLIPTTDGYPDVDTYRTMQFYLELGEIKKIGEE